MKKPAAKTAGLIFENRNLKCRLPYLASFRLMTDIPTKAIPNRHAHG
jgi:hypothetical protein